jgi:hypothetical protein
LTENPKITAVKIPKARTADRDVFITVSNGGTDSLCRKEFRFAMSNGDRPRPLLRPKTKLEKGQGDRGHVKR